jgi:hypothetical protein
MLGPKGPFCHCYQNGKFTEPNISVNEMMSIPRLRRWQQAPAGQSG